MTRFIATVQEGHLARQRQQELARGLGTIAAESFGDDPDSARVAWKVIRKGFGWTAGKASNTSVVFCVVPDDLPEPQRAQLMTRVNDFWVGATGADSNELLIFTVSEEN